MIPMSRVIDHDASTDKMVVHFYANLGNISLRVTTQFGHHELEAMKQYHQTVTKAFTTIYNNHVASRDKRIPK
jgi:hypothetical protein